MTKGLSMNIDRVFPGRRGLVLAAAVALGAAALGLGPSPAWVDSRVPAQERALLAETEGFALPALDSVAWVGDAPTKADLADKVVLIQSWTHASQEGRAVLRRVENLIERSGRAEDVVLVTLHTPEKASDARAFIDRRTPSGFVAIDEGGRLCDALGLWKRPTTIVADRSGTIRVAGADLLKLDQILVALADDTSAAPGDELPTRDVRDAQALRAPGEDHGAGAGGAKFPPIQGTVANANDIRGKKGPELTVQKWASKPPVLDGKVLMIEFWATWCNPCIKGIPHLNELAAAHRDELVIVGVSDETISEIQQFMRKTKMDYHVGSDQSKTMARATGHRGIPHAIVMSPDGIVRWQGHPATLTDETMSAIIAASGIGAKGAAPGAGPLRWSAP